jgi:hypothetical protein
MLTTNASLCKRERHAFAAHFDARDGGRFATTATEAYADESLKVGSRRLRRRVAQSCTEGMRSDR